ncbi:MAG: hypothetical protein JST80_04080 [Bdellovibrionales bacterium]|nr:hypothetical protein [Bdellovibrionales bacterium]
MKALLLLTVTLTSTGAFAQQTSGDIVRDSAQLASEIRRESPYLTRAQAAAISEKIQDIRTIIYGGSSGSDLNLTCVSRDNDGRDPWVLGVRDGINVSRLTSAVFANNADCTSAINNAKSFRGVAVTCVSRDNDGRAPFQFATIVNDGGVKANKVAKSISGSYADCQGTLNRALPSSGRDQLTYCTSRDNDGRAPFVAVNLDIRSGNAQAGSESFNAIDQCWGFLGTRL